MKAPDEYMHATGIQLMYRICDEIKSTSQHPEARVSDL